MRLLPLILMLFFLISCQDRAPDIPLPESQPISDMEELPPVNVNEKPAETITEERRFQFNPAIPHAEYDGVTIGMYDHYFEKKGEAWGKLTGVSIIIDNQRDRPINPSVKIVVFEDQQGILQSPSQTIQLNLTLKSKDYLDITLPLDLSVSGLDRRKEIWVTLGEGYKPFQEIITVKIPVTLE